MLIVYAATLVVCSAASLFGCAYTKSVAKAGILSVALSILLAIAFGFLVQWITMNYFPPSFAERKWWEQWTPTILSLAALAAVCTILTWLACRRLRWDR
jgi:hypothetical protein